MLQTLAIQNFKSIRDLRYPINKLNVLVGPNSSGKTSVLQSIALLKQSLYELKFDGELVKLGNFRDAVYNHNDKGTIGLDFEIFARIGDSSFPTSIYCSIEIKGDDERKPFVFRSIVAEGRRNETLVDYKRGRYKSPNAHRKEAVREIATISDFQNVSFGMKGILPVATSGASDQIDKYREIYDQIVDDLTHFLFYLSARRGYCDRSDFVDKRYSDKPYEVGMFGEKTIPVLAHIQSDEEYAVSMERIHFWQNKFGLTESVAGLVGGKGAPSYSLKVKNETTGIQSSIVDIGFGINQLFPVIVQCFYAPKGSLIMIEQPEAHLHPRYQADVADFLIDVVNYGNRVIVETHSEHLLLRLQRRIAEKKISSKQVNINYFDLGPKGTKASVMKLDENGYFVGKIPEGFFEEGFQEAFAHIKAVHKQDETTKGGRK